MKALWHPECSTITSPNPNGAWTFCICQKAAARWRDPAAGQFEVAEFGDQFRSARVIGFHNGWLLLDREAASPLASDEWQRRTAALLEATPDNYLFKRRMSPVVLLAPGETGDTFRVPWIHTQPDGTGG